MVAEIITQKQVQQQFGLSKAKLWKLTKANRVKSFLDIEQGKKKGRRYYDAKSIRKYFDGIVDTDPENN